MNKLLIVSLVFSFSFLIETISYSQKLTLSDLVNICGKKDWESVNTFLNAKGWDYHTSKKGNYNTYSTITWSYEKSDYNDEAQAWFYLFTVDGSPSKILYTIFNKPSYLNIKNSITSLGFKLIDSKIEDNEIITYYSNSAYTLKESNENREKSSSFSNASSIIDYSFTLIRKNGVYDTENGEKTEYYDNGNISVTYTLKNGIGNGITTHYHENGKVYYSVLVKDGKETGKMIQYDENGLIINEINFKNGLKEGNFINYIYSNNDKIVALTRGKFINDKKEGLWKTVLINDTSEAYSYTNYQNDLKNGESKEYINKDTIQVANFKDNVLDGDYKLIRRRVMFDSDDSHFDDTLYYLNTEYEGQYKNGLKEGTWILYDYIGNKYLEGEYLNGKKTGKWIQYVTAGDKTGKILEETEYLNDKKNGFSKTFFDIELVEDSIQKEDSVTTSSFKTTAIDLEIHYSNDLKDGKIVLKDSLGNIKVDGYYTDDLKDKTWIFYNNDSSFYIIGYNKGIKQIANYYDKEKELYLTETYYNTTNNYNMTECRYYENNILTTKHVLHRIFNCYLVDVFQYNSAIQDTIELYTYKVCSDEEYYYDLFLNYGIKEGDCYLSVNNLKIVEGKYCNDKKCDTWYYRYPDSKVYSINKYNEDSLIEEVFWQTERDKVFFGTLEINNSLGKEIIKIKYGLRDGKSIIIDKNGNTILETKYSKGKILK